MPSTVEQLSPSRVKITVEVPFGDLKPNMDKAYRDLASQVQIPGFRKGKVPPRILDQRFGRGAILSEALNDAIPDLYNSAVTDNKLNPLAQPEVEVTKLEDGDLVEFTAEVDVRPEFDVPAFNTVTATVDAIEISDEAVEQRLESLRGRFGSMEDVDRPVEDGDHLTIDLVARKDGEVLEDANVSDISYEVGTGRMVDGLDEAVIGLSAGESKTFTSTLVGGPLKDEEAEIEVTVKKVQIQDLPAADDEFAQLASEFDTIEELREDQKKELVQTGRVEQANAARDAVLEALIGQVDAEVPEGVVNSEIEARKEQINNQLAQAGLTLERYLEEADEDDEDAPKDVESFWADTEKRAADALKAQMILDKIADDRELGVEQEELTQFIVRRAQASGVSPDQEVQHMLEHNHVPEYMGEIRRAKVLDLIMSEATVTDSNGEKIELANLQPDGSIADPAELAAKAAAEAAAASESDDSETVEGETVEGEESEEAKA
ncbi:trigger factor [Microlunatus soli]|uniref:Trigger factor n=1 Tax=Microlunatus soli TaxID=630515 RepID=A0A1H1Y6Y7_9ACTN|nr:trigger factor [Microlunatus soli]SDT16776.1 trigger factor [Microlunatus soli]